jgi:hypothetical protein
MADFAMLFFGLPTAFKFAFCLFLIFAAFLPLHIVVVFGLFLAFIIGFTTAVLGAAFDDRLDIVDNDEILLSNGVKGLCDPLFEADESPRLNTPNNPSRSL